MTNSLVEDMARAIGSARRDSPNGDYALKMRLSFDEQTRAAEACLSVLKDRLSEDDRGLVEALGSLARAMKSPVDEAWIEQAAERIIVLSGGIHE